MHRGRIWRSETDPRHSLLSAADGLQHADSGRGLSLEALTDVVGVGSGPVLEQHLSGLAGSGQVLQVLDLVGGPATHPVHSRHGLQRRRTLFQQVQ